MEKKKSCKKKEKLQDEEFYPEPKRLSKFGEWMKAHPNGLEGKILDMRAVMR
ncbi:MAG: hypothetical protein FWF51_11450 [Chitinivibrionia bacterium]|nr:hypothetical protein [Chitinivibrionia bacterium]